MVKSIIKHILAKKFIRVVSGLFAEPKPPGLNPAYAKDYKSALTKLAKLFDDHSDPCKPHEEDNARCDGFDKCSDCLIDWALNDNKGEK